jgi:hypothetical protein
MEIFIKFLIYESDSIKLHAASLLLSLSSVSDEKLKTKIIKEGLFNKLFQILGPLTKQLVKVLEGKCEGEIKEVEKVSEVEGTETKTSNEVEETETKTEIEKKPVSSERKGSITQLQTLEKASVIKNKFLFVAKEYFKNSDFTKHTLVSVLGETNALVVTTIFTVIGELLQSPPVVPWQIPTKLSYSFSSDAVSSLMVDPIFDCFLSMLGLSIITNEARIVNETECSLSVKSCVDGVKWVISDADEEGGELSSPQSVSLHLFLLPLVLNPVLLSYYECEKSAKGKDAPERTDASASVVSSSYFVDRLILSKGLKSLFSILRIRVNTFLVKNDFVALAADPLIDILLVLLGGVANEGFLNAQSRSQEKVIHD